MSRQIVIRADASTRIGGGHVMRCLSLADKLAEQGDKILFICRAHPGHLANAIRQRGHDCVLLKEPGAEYLDGRITGYDAWLGDYWRQDALDSISALEHLDKPHCLIVDHYALDRKWEEQLAPHCSSILVIDDLANRHHHCDLLLDQTYGRDPASYQDLVSDGCRLLCGPEYAPLRPQFSLLRSESLHRRDRAGKIERLLVAIGAMDPDNITGMVLTALSGIPTNITVDVVLGSKAPYLAEIREQVAHHPLEATLHVDVREMASLMSSADLAIGASGTTSWERSVLGLPAVTIVMAENQSYIDQKLAEAGAIHSLGWFEDLSTDRLTNEITTLINQPAQVAKISLACRDICDGLGTERLREAIYG